MFGIEIRNIIFYKMSGISYRKTSIVRYRSISKISTNNIISENNRKYVHEVLVNRLVKLA